MSRCWGALVALVGLAYPANAALIKPTAGFKNDIRAVGSLMNATDGRKLLLSTAAHNSSAGAWPAPGSGEPAGIIHFLFLVTGALPHAGIWKMFFAEAPRNSWRAYVHCKDPDACARSGLPLELPEIRRVATVPSWYCHDLVSPMSQLLSVALSESPANGQGGKVEKFVFVSDSTLPVKPFSEVHKALTATDDSDMCIFPQDQWGTANVDGKYIRLVKHHQWVVLNRQHSELFVKNWKPVDARGVWSVPLKGGTWEGKERNLSPQHFNRAPYSNWCTDEWAFFATIFGAFEPDQWGQKTYTGLGMVSQQSPTGSQVQGRCRTFTYWANDGADFTALGAAIHADPTSKMSCYPKCGQHPAGFDALGDQSLTSLRHSSFLFARKMSPSLWMPNYYGLVLSK